MTETFPLVPCMVLGKKDILFENLRKQDEPMVVNKLISRF